jgi:hypothetical protein
MRSERKILMLEHGIVPFTDAYKRLDHGPPRMRAIGASKN